MQKIGKIKVYDNWNGMILSENKEYKFRKDDLIFEDVVVGDEVTFVPEEFVKTKILTARFIKKKELSK